MYNIVVFNKTTFDIKSMPFYISFTHQPPLLFQISSNKFTLLHADRLNKKTYFKLQIFIFLNNKKLQTQTYYHSTYANLLPFKVCFVIIKDSSIKNLCKKKPTSQKAKSRKEP